MSMSIRGRGGSYKIMNPQLSQTVESIQTIITQLNNAPDRWWLSEKVVGTILQMKSAKEQEDKEQKNQLDARNEADTGHYTRHWDDDSISLQSVGRFRPGRHNYDDGDSNIDDDDDDYDDDAPMIDLQSGE